MSTNFNASSSTSAPPTGFAVSPPPPFGIPTPNPNSVFSSTPVPPAPPTAFGVGNFMIPNPSTPFGSPFHPPASSSSFPTQSLFGSTPSFGFGWSNTSSPAPATTGASSSPFGAFGSPSPLWHTAMFGPSPKLESVTVSNEEREKLSKEEEEHEFYVLGISADKVALLGNIKRIHPSCLSSLRLCSKSHRRAAYEHLVQVALDLKAIGFDGDPNSYAELASQLEDLEFYGFDMSWLREEAVKLQQKVQVEAKRRDREELMKQVQAIDAELATIEAANLSSITTVSSDSRFRDH